MNLTDIDGNELVIGGWYRKGAQLRKVYRIKENEVQYQSPSMVSRYAHGSLTNMDIAIAWFRKSIFVGMNFVPNDMEARKPRPLYLTDLSTQDLLDELEYRDGVKFINTEPLIILYQEENDD